MGKLQFIKDANSRYFKYFFNNNQEGLLIIGETDDYFYFKIMLKESDIKNNYILDFSLNNVLYFELSNLLKGFKLIEVMEEGTNEKKSISFAKNKNKIQIQFNLTNEERLFYSIELANLQRLGDTRFAKLIPIRNYNKKDFFEIESSFRHEFKARIHKMLDNLENKYYNIIEAEKL